MPIAALAVHQLRYFLAFGPRGETQLSETGHSYLQSVTPWLVLVLALGLGAFLGRLARAWRSGEVDRHRTTRPLALWLAATLALVLIYAGQEFLEGLFATGHPDGLVGIFGDGGWWALPAAVVVGGALALLVRGGDAAVALAARLRTRRPVLARAAAVQARPAPVFVVPASPLAACAPSRAPPLAC
jgi:hypothetical protein